MSKRARSYPPCLRHQRAVDPDLGVAEDAVEFQPECLARIRLRYGEGSFVPADGRFGELEPDGRERVDVVGFFARRQVHRPVVRQADPLAALY